jgi:type IV secretion system protein VirB11
VRRDPLFEIRKGAMEIANIQNVVGILDLIDEVTQRAPCRAIAQAIDVVVSVERTATGRRIRDVSRVVGLKGEA